MEWKEECHKIALIRENWVLILFINSYFLIDYYERNNRFQFFLIIIVW